MGYTKLQIRDFFAEPFCVAENYIDQMSESDFWRFCDELVEELDAAITDCCQEWMEAIKDGKSVGVALVDWRGKA